MPGTHPHPHAALVLGLDSHGLAAARALQRAGVRVYALERDLSVPGAATRCVHRVFEARAFEGQALVDQLLAIRKELASYESVALLCINDRQVETVGSHLPQLSPAYALAWAHCADAVLRLQRKSELEALCATQGLRYPRSALLEDGVSDAAEGFCYPVIVKPVRPLSSFKTYLAAQPGQLRDWLATHRDDGPLLAQEYVAGDDTRIHFGALLLDRGHVVSAMTGRKLASHPPARGQAIVAETTNDAAVLAETLRFFSGLGLSGPVSLELKYAPNGELWVIEPTVGRTDFWAELCIAAGFNQPLMEFELACGLPVTPTTTLQQRTWFDTERAPLAYLHWAWQQGSLRPARSTPTFPFAGHGDSGPVSRQLRRLVRRVGEAAARRLGLMRSA